MTLIFTAEAEKRLGEIFNYYYLNASRKVALKIVTDIIKETEILITKPHIGIREPLLENRRFQYFFIVIKNYNDIF